MTKRNIIRTSILLLILVIVIGIILNTAKPKALGIVGLDLSTASVPPASYRVGLSVLGRQTLPVDAQDVNALKHEGLRVDAVELSGASLNLLNT